MLDLLQAPVTTRDHVRGPLDAPVTIVEYADFACPFCAAAHPVLQQLQARFRRELRLVFRHNPRGELHPGAHLAAQAAEAAGLQGQFWPMHDALFERAGAVSERALLRTARALELDLDLFRSDLYSRAVAHRVRDDEVGGLRSGVIGTPTLFINGLHFRDKPDLVTLSGAVAELVCSQVPLAVSTTGANKWISN